MDRTAGRRWEIVAASRPVLPRHTRLRFDATRERWVLLAPERVLAPDEIAVEVLQLCDGNRNVDGIVDQLAEKYLADKGFLVEAREGPKDDGSGG